MYLSWKKLWSTHGTTDASIRMFMTNSVLPFWVQCRECHKWRQWSKSTTPIPEFLKNYVCGTMASGKVRFFNVFWKISKNNFSIFVLSFTWFFIFNWISLVIMQYVIYLYWQIDFKRNILYLSLFLYRNQSWKIPVKFQRIRFVSIIPMKYMY